MNPLDAAWLFTESRATPNHVGGLLQFRLPKGAPQDFMRALMTEFRGHREFVVPWNRRLKYAFNKNPVSVWIEDDAIDLEHHTAISCGYAVGCRARASIRRLRPGRLHHRRPALDLAADERVK